MHYQARYNLKLNWEEYLTMIVKELGYNDLYISACEIDVHIIKPTKKRFDLDNLSIKFIQDALVKNNVITDDNYTVIQKLTYSGEYKNGVRKMIITINY